MRYIYAIETVLDHVKIGMSENPRKRIRKHTGLFPTNPLLVGIWRTGSLNKTARIETMLHHGPFGSFLCTNRKELFAIPAVCAFTILVQILGEPMETQIDRYKARGSVELNKFFKPIMNANVKRIREQIENAATLVSNQK